MRPIDGGKVDVLVSAGTIDVIYAPFDQLGDPLAKASEVFAVVIGASTSPAA